MLGIKSLKPPPLGTPLTIGLRFFRTYLLVVSHNAFNFITMSTLRYYNVNSKNHNYDKQILRVLKIDIG